MRRAPTEVTVPAASGQVTASQAQHGRRSLRQVLLALLVAAVLVPSAVGAAPSDTYAVIGDGESVSNQDLALRLSTLTIFDTRTRVVLARDDLFADSLAAGALQGIDGPLLLVPGTGSLPPEVSAELRRLAPDRVVLLGGTAAISSDLEAEVRALGVTVERIAGANRFETAVAIAGRAPAGEVMVARGTGEGDRAFADAIAAGGHAARTGTGIVLTPTDDLADATREHVRGRHVIIVGGDAAVSPAVAAQLAQVAASVERVAGANRFETAVALARRFGSEGTQTVDHVILTEGLGPDAWAGGFAAAHRSFVRNAPIVLGTASGLPEATRAYLATLDGTTITDRNFRAPVLTCVLPSSVCDQARAAMGLPDQDAADCALHNLRDGVELYERSAHWAMWWGGDAMGRDADLRRAAQRTLVDLEYAWQTAIVDGDLPMPPGAPRLCANVYLHDTGGGVAGDIGPGVGTDDEGVPFIALVPNLILPLADQQPGPDVGTIEYTQHEAFHIAQYNRAGTPYEWPENVWWIESSAEWFTRQQYPTDTGSLRAVAAWFLLPQMPLWASFDAVPGGAPFNDTIGGHAYGGGYFLEHLTNDIADPSLVYSGFQHAAQSGQQHLHDELERRGIDLADVYGDFVARAPTLDYPEGDTLATLIDQWLDTASPRVDDRIAASHATPDTGGFVRVADRLRPAPWSFNAIRADVGSAGSVTVRFAGDATGTDGGESEFRVTVVISDGDDRTYTAVPLSASGAGDVTVTAPAGSELWLVVAATPHQFAGVQQYGYRYSFTS